MRVDVTRQAGASNNQRPQPARRGKAKVSPTWRMRRAGFFSSVRLAIMRLTRSWELLLAVAVGMLVAVVLICTVPLYNSLVANIQLQRAINTDDPTIRNIQPIVQNNQISTGLRDQDNAAVRALAQRYLSGATLATPTYYPVSANMLLLQAGAQAYLPSDPKTPNIVFEAFDYSAAAPHMHFISGTTPQDTSANQKPQVVVTQQMAQDFNLKVGSPIKGTEFGDHTHIITLTVSGIWAPNENDPFWNGETFARATSGTVVYKLLITSNTFFTQLSVFSSVGMHQNWIYYANPNAINMSNIGQIATNIGQMRARLNGNVATLPGVGDVTLQTHLDSVINDIQSQQSLLTLPLYVIVAQIVGLALLFVAAMASLLIEGQNQEISTLKSRGASGMQLLSTFTTQGIILGIIAAIAGPFLAAALGLALVHWFVPASVINGSGVGSNYFSQIANPGAAILPAIVGALLGAGAVAFTAWQSARMDVLAFRREQGRASRVPFWKRYYLDVVLAVLCLVGYLELGQFGDASTRAQIGGSASPLLLVTPALLLLAGALLVLRIFPLGAALGARVAARGKGLTSLLAFSQVERNPSRYSRMTLLLVLAVGLGLFALTFDSSLVQNGYDRAAYTVGSDIRFTAITSGGNGLGTHDTAILMQRLQKLPGVLNITQAYRGQASTTADLGGEQVNVLGIDPTTFQQAAGVVSWRNDYSSTPLSTLLSEMKANEQGGKSGSTANPIWAIVSTQFATRYHVKVGDQFILQLNDTALGVTAFVVGATTDEFPTLYPQDEPGGFIVADLNDYLNAIISNAPPGVAPSIYSANEFWMRTTNNAAQHAQLMKQLSRPDIIPQFNADTQIFSLADQLSSIVANPISAGMRGLLLVGAVTAALLAILGSIVQSLLATRQRARQFAVMRTVGMSGRQLTSLLLGEQVIVYLFGLIGGTLLGLLLATATLPFLQFSDTTINTARLGVPSYTLVFNGQTALYFYVALVVAFIIALLIAARYATSIGLGKALRLGED